MAATWCQYQVPLADADRYVMAGKETIMQATLCLVRHFPVSRSLRY